MEQSNNQWPTSNSPLSRARERQAKSDGRDTETLALPTRVRAVRVRYRRNGDGQALWTLLDRAEPTKKIMYQWALHDSD